MVLVVVAIKEMVERQEVQVVKQVGREKMQVVGKGERMGRGELSKAMRGEHGRDLKRLRLGQEQEKEVGFDIIITRVRS